MSEQEIRDMNELDNLAEKAGGYVTAFSDNSIHYDYRGISDYCKVKGIEPLDMTLRELKKFVVEQ